MVRSSRHEERHPHPAASGIRRPTGPKKLRQPVTNAARTGLERKLRQTFHSPLVSQFSLDLGIQARIAQTPTMGFRTLGRASYQETH